MRKITPHLWFDKEARVVSTRSSSVRPNQPAGPAALAPGVTYRGAYCYDVGATPFAPPPWARCRICRASGGHS